MVIDLERYPECKIDSKMILHEDLNFFRILYIDIHNLKKVIRTDTKIFTVVMSEF